MVRLRENMPIYINHRFIRHWLPGLADLELLRETATKGPWRGQDFVLRMHVTGCRRFLKWWAIFPRVVLDIPDGEQLELPGNYGVISCPVSDLIAVAVSQVAEELVEVWWSGTENSGMVRCWQSGLLGQEARSNPQVNQLLYSCFGLPNAATMANLWDALVAAEAPPGFSGQNRRAELRVPRHY